jgi:hypothetical protein
VFRQAMAHRATVTSEIGFRFLLSVQLFWGLFFRPLGTYTVPVPTVKCAAQSNTVLHCAADLTQMPIRLVIVVAVRLVTGLTTTFGQ